MRAFVHSLLVMLLMLSAPPALAAGGIGINPPRVIFDDRDRTADLNVSNSGDTPAVFKVELHYLKQTETGSYVDVTSPLDPAFDPATAIVVSPKQVRLPPHAKQRVRVTLKRPPDLKPGDYRVHLRLTRVTQPSVAQNADPTKITPIMTVNVGFSVPVLIRQGQSDGYATIKDVKLIPAAGRAPAFLEVNVERGGGYSTIGNLKVFWTSPGGEEIQVGALNNFNIFTENTRRISKVPLTNPNIPNGMIRVVYEGDGPDRGKIFGQKVFPVGG